MNQHFLPSLTLRQSHWGYALLLLLALAHLPFLTADADYNLSWSRGPWTDEGLHTCQVRNFIQHNDTSLDKSDNLIKTPLLGAIFYGAYKVVGVSLASSRMVLVLLTLFLLAIVVRVNQYLYVFICLFIPTTLFEYYIFNYTHLALSEVLCSVCILTGLVFFYKILVEDKHRLRNNLLSAGLLSMTYFLKIQYLYIIFLVPIYLCLFLMISSIREKKWNTLYLQFLLQHVLLLFVLGMIYVFAWYLPNKVLYDYILADQTTNRYVEWHEIRALLQFYYDTIFVGPELKYFTSLFFLSLVLGLVIAFSKKSSVHFKILFSLMILWILLELHKLPMRYLPSRYLISTYIAMGSLSALVLRECLYDFFSKPKWMKLLLPLSMIATLVVVIGNVKDYKQAFTNRQFSMAEINAALKNIPMDNRPIVGPWAPSLSWGVDGFSFPVWYNYFNDKDLIKKYHPKVIISELNEDDSGMAYKNQHINIDNIAESISYYKVAKWDIKVLILK
ncbi:MAG: hypothetical protein JWO58_293 [Chitinophagaceae bacterium]|nr:hypothetical protein [Chitinophagaceae bacterium]